MALCVLTAYGLQSVMLSDTTWRFNDFLERTWPKLHSGRSGVDEVDSEYKPVGDPFDKRN